MSGGLIRSTSLALVLAMLGLAASCVPSSSKIANRETDKVAARPALLPEFLVEGGTFSMGSTKSMLDNERPVHHVTVSSFLMGTTEVTQAMYQSLTGDTPSFFGGDGNLPVESVRWFDAVAFCNLLSEKAGLKPVYAIDGETVTADWSASGYRLPTEAEWEYAARGGSKSQGFAYAGSNTPGLVAWYSKNSGDMTHPVGTKAPNELGLFDLSGNVWEWCWDWYGSYANAAQTDPAGASSGDNRVSRGGSWGLIGSFLQPSFRIINYPGSGINHDGFRLVRRP